MRKAFRIAEGAAWINDDGPITQSLGDCDERDRNMSRSDDHERGLRINRFDERFHRLSL